MTNIRPCAKLIGTDVEIGNHFAGEPNSDGPASRLLWEQFPGISRFDLGLSPPVGIADASVQGPDGGQEFLRRFNPTGAVSIDLKKLELQSNLVRSARDLGAVVRAQYNLLHQAYTAAQAALPNGRRLLVHLCNYDASSERYFGAHVSVLLSRAAWEEIILGRRPLSTLSLASFLASAAPITGQGAVLFVDGRWTFVISSRIAATKVLISESTTTQRGLLNSRSESLSGRDEDLCRLHLICCDTPAISGAAFMSYGLLQMCAALLEAHWPIDEAGLLADPLSAAHIFNCDLTFSERVPSVSGASVSLLDVQRAFLKAAREFANYGGFDGIVPEYALLLDLWRDTLRGLEQRDLARLARRLGFALKYLVLSRQRASMGHPSWGAPEIRCLDFQFSQFPDGLFWANYEPKTEQYVDEKRIRAMSLPPSDTNAFGRTALIDRFRSALADLDWDRLDFYSDPDRSRIRTLWMSPLSCTREHIEPILRSAGSLNDMLDGLGADAAVPVC